MGSMLSLSLLLNNIYNHNNHNHNNHNNYNNHNNHNINKETTSEYIPIKNDNNTLMEKNKEIEKDFDNDRET